MRWLVDLLILIWIVFELLFNVPAMLIYFGIAIYYPPAHRVSRIVDGFINWRISWLVSGVIWYLLASLIW